MNSILDSIKKMLGMDADYTAFDTDIIIMINSALMSLVQIGIGPPDGYSIHSSAESWTDFLGDATDLEGAKNYVYLKTRLLFDPPSSSAAENAMKDEIKELEWRLNIARGGIS